MPEMKNRKKTEIKIVTAPWEGPGSYENPTPEQEELRLQGLRILARMIARAYLRGELDSKSKPGEFPNERKISQTRKDGQDR